MQVLALIGTFFLTSLLGYAPKFAEGTAERCGEARGATGSHPAAAANRRDSASKGEIIRALRDPNSAKKLATGLDEMPGQRGILEVNWRRWSSLWQPSGQRKKRGDKKKEGGPRGERKVGRRDRAGLPYIYGMFI